MNCPICDKEIKNMSRDYEEGNTLEEYAECKDEKHYFSSQYAYGNSQESIGRVNFNHHHADSKEIRNLLSKQYSAVLELEKEYYKKINS